jgi:hypothetical protein
MRSAGERLFVLHFLPCYSFTSNYVLLLEDIVFHK